MYIGYTWAKHFIRDFPDHATFRDKGAKLTCADKLGVFFYLTLCNEAKFDPLQLIKYDGPATGLEKTLISSHKKSHISLHWAV